MQDLPPPGHPNMAEVNEPAKKKQTFRGRRASLFHKPTFKEALITETEAPIETEMEGGDAGAADPRFKKKTTKKVNRNRRQSVMPSAYMIN